MVDGGNGKQPPLKSWQISDEQTLGVLPPGGFLQDFMGYTEKCTHAPLWFQLGATLAVLITACAGRELRVTRKDGAYSYIPMNFWPIIIGRSGDGKDAAVKPAMRVLTKAAPQYVLASDFTPEALQSALSEGTGIGVIWKSELSHLFRAGKKSYSSDLIEYLLTMYNGTLHTRATRKDGTVSVMRPRVSLIGNIPPDVLTQEVSRSMWSSGLIPRITPFAALRTRWLEIETHDPDKETDYAGWVKQFCVEPRGAIVIPPHAARSINEWYFKEIECRRHEYPPDVFSALQRLQKKALRIAAVIAVSESRTAATGVLMVMPNHTAMALEIIKLIKKSTLGVFKLTSSGAGAAKEEQVLDLIRDHPGITVPELGEIVGLSRYMLRPIVIELAKDDDIEVIPVAASEQGGVKKGLFPKD